MAHPKHAQVRQRYHYRSGSCGVSEVDTGGELTVDHHQLRAADGDESDINLVYACIKCNRFKGNFFPSADDLQHGRRVLHPMQDDFSVHLCENAQTGHLELLTETGRFFITLLQLNRHCEELWCW